MSKLKESFSKKWSVPTRFFGDALAFIKSYSEEEMRRMVEANGYEFRIGIHYPSEEQIALARMESKASNGHA